MKRSSDSALSRGHVASPPPFRCGRAILGSVFETSLHNPRPATAGLRWRRIGLGFVFLWFVIGGVAHFALTDLEMRIVPPWVPWPRAVVLTSGVFELSGAAGLLWHNTRRSAGIGLFLLTIAVTPAHFYMLQHPELFNVPYWALLARLPLQAGLLAIIAWCTFRS